jgi:hypothetical protein
MCRHLFWVRFSKVSSSGPDISARELRVAEALPNVVVGLNVPVTQKILGPELPQKNTRILIQSLFDLLISSA